MIRWNIVDGKLRQDWMMEAFHEGRNAPVSQPAEEADLKSVQCGFESHQGHMRYYFSIVKKYGLLGILDGLIHLRPFNVILPHNWRRTICDKFDDKVMGK